jgi:FkbM family methyltransferase
MRGSSLLPRAVVRFKHLVRLVDANRIFRLVYNRTPTLDEQKQLAHLTALAGADNPTGLYRAIVNGYDHYHLPTPFTVRFTERDVTYVSVSGVEIAIDRLDLSIGLPLQSGLYEPHLLAFYQTRVQSGMTFVDVGANIGLYALLAAKLVGPSGCVHCFEPNSENCRLLLLSLKRNGFQHVVLHPYALGEQAGHALFSTSVSSNGGLMSNTEARLVAASCQVIPVMRLDDAIQGPIHYLKLDVEGAEGRVCAGAQRLIEHNRPVITSEFSLEMLGRVSEMSGLAYLDFFRQRGYTIFLIQRQPPYDLVPIPDHTAFVRDYGEPTRIEDLALIPA